ncbi:MAG: 4-(cytidine 5'-diphospho)-2-C-methyl-D-erythritol kinase [Candidatus Jidaibacter sp.]|jgi:4-diphosphocytidyl-2-C-methyl-D-erythritol kinase|nr:4-(cytidine 5'-diphospho)-2-C-methyl-D-erythritol kinase [Candidatus Jidaibacter sp.]
MFIKAPAKINLFLNIIGKRADGYHLLESLFAPLNLADEITIEPSSRIEVEIPGLDCVNNTAKKAAGLLKDFYQVAKGARITIHKKIPIGAGLGGSSADAGALLKALPKFWSIAAEEEDLRELALKIGADVPYFLSPVPAMVTGIGEVIQPIKLGQFLHIVIIYPGFELSAKEVYAVGEFTFSSPIDTLNSENVFFGKNDLQASAIKIKPQIEQLIAELKSSDGCISAKMSGSGSACFGIFETEQLAIKAKNAFSERYFSYYEYLSI